MQLETQIEHQSKSFEETSNQYALEFDRFKKDGQEYVEALNYEYEKKIKALEEQLKITEDQRKDLTIENKRLNDINLSNQLEFDT